MTELGASPVLLMLVNFVLALTVLEAAALVLLHRLAGRGVPPQDFLLNLLSGLCLVLALRAVLGQAAWPVVAGCLLLSGLLHAADMRRRWRRRTLPLNNAP